LRLLPAAGVLLHRSNRGAALAGPVLFAVCWFLLLIMFLLLLLVSAAVCCLLFAAAVWRRWRPAGGRPGRAAGADPAGPAPRDRPEEGGKANCRPP